MIQMKLIDTNRPLRSIGVVIISIIMVSLFGILFLQRPANAIREIGPDPADFAGGIRYVLENTGQLQVTSSYVPIYYPYDPGSVVIDAYSFKFENHGGAHPNVRFSYRDQNNNPASRKGQSDFSFRVGGFTYDPNTGYYFTLVQADLVDQGGTYPVIYYRLRAPSPGIIGYYAANGRNFAIGNDARCDSYDGSGCGNYHNYSLPFGTQCQVQGSVQVQAQIYDGDNGNSGVQPSNFSVSIYDETDGTTQNPGPSPSNGEQDGQTATYTFTVKQYHKYRFKVNNVYANNVMQIRLPYDSIYYYSDCRQLEITDRIYGSWGEYAVMSTGQAKGIGAGSAFAGRGLSHTTTCSYTFLLLTNAPSGGNCKSVTATQLGNYTTNRTIPDVAGTYTTTAAKLSLSGDVDISGLEGTYNVTGGALRLTGGTLPTGKWAVINATGHNVTIAGNLQYADNRVNSADELPQLIIIGDNINIESGVTRVDAWLVSKGTINTCSNVDKASITALNCNAVLTVNGPVMAGRLLLYRTGGSGNGDLSGEPAEIFNLRPDAYMWGMTQAATSGRIETVYQRELPPRF